MRVLDSMIFKCPSVLDRIMPSPHHKEVMSYSPDPAKGNGNCRWNLSHSSGNLETGRLPQISWQSPVQSQGSLQVKKGAGGAVSQSDGALKAEEGAMHQRMWEPSRNGKRIENNSPQGLLKEQSCQHLDFSPVGPILNF